MYQVIKKLVRPNKSVEFPDLPSVIDPLHRDHFINNYLVTDKHLFRQDEYDDSGLQLTTTIIWESEQAFQDFINDPIIQSMFTSNTQLFKSLGITEEIVSKTAF